MGNGHPVAAVITRREIAARFADDTVFFSTFGGNPVSVAAALAVLDVLEDERVLPRVQAAGEALRAGIRDVATRHAAIGDVRGMGLAIGVEIVTRSCLEGARPGRPPPIKEGLRDRGVLVGTTGTAGNVLKVRPPLAFTEAHVPVFTDALEAALAAARNRFMPTHPFADVTHLPPSGRIAATAGGLRREYDASTRLRLRRSRDRPVRADAADRSVGRCAAVHGANSATERRRALRTTPRSCCARCGMRNAPADLAVIAVDPASIERRLAIIPAAQLLTSGGGLTRSVTSRILSSDGRRCRPDVERA